MRTTFSRRLGWELAARFNYGAAFGFAMVAAGLATVVHLVWLVTSFLGFRHRLDVATMVIVDWDSSILMMHIRIGVALLLSIVGLSSRRVIGLFLSVLALAWVGLEYLAWFLWSFRIKSNAGIDSLPSSAPHALNLYGATTWNAVVLALVIAVLVWEIRRLIRFGRSQPAVQSLDGGEVGR